MFPTVDAMFNVLSGKSEDRYNNFKIKPIESLKNVYDEAYLTNPTWLGGDNEFVCLFIDLDNSSQLSFKKNIQTIAKLYDYFTQNIVDVMNQDGLRADYIDIKGDGAFGIYEGDNAALKALCAAVTFKSFFELYIRPKFQTINDTINCKLAIHRDKILVKKIGKRGEGNSNEVWAGRLVNNTVKLADYSKNIYQNDSSLSRDKNSILLISNKIYEDIGVKKEFTQISCGHDLKLNNQTKSAIWKQVDCSDDISVYGDKLWYMNTVWCKLCGTNYMKEVLDL